MHLRAPSFYAASILAVAISAGLPSQGTAQSASVPHLPYTFSNVAIIAGGFTTGIVPHPTRRGLMYLRTDIGGAYRWDDAAAHWTPLTDWVHMSTNNMLGIESIAVDPADPNLLYLAAGTYDNPNSPDGVILRSSNQGRTFQITKMPFKMGGNEDGRFAGERLAVDPHLSSTLYFGSRNDGLWKSTDGAQSFSKVDSFPGKSDNRIGVVFVTFDPSSGKGKSPTGTLYAGVSTLGSNLFQSNDAGRTWSAVPGAPTSLLPNHGLLAKDGTLYLTYGDAPGPNNMKNGAVWKLDTHSGRWTNITPEIPAANGNTTFGYGGLALDLQHPGSLIVATLDHWNKGDEIYRTTDGGAHWTGLKANSVRDDSLTPYLARPSGEVDAGHWMGAMTIDPFDANHALYGTGATVWATHDLTQLDTQHTTHWTVGAAGIEETAVIDLLSPSKGPHLFSALGDIGCFRNDNFAISPRGGNLKNPQNNNCTSFDAASLNPDLMVRSGRSSGQQAHGAYSTDNGSSWTAFPYEPLNGSNGGRITISADGSTLLWATGKGVVGSSVDKGAHWKTTDKAPPRGQIAADRVQPVRFFLYDPEAGKAYRADGPQLSFQPLPFDVPKAGRLYTAPGHENDLWFASRTGLFHAESAASSPIVKLPGVDEAYVLGFGMAASGSTYPTLFLAGKISGQQGIFRSADQGKTWAEIDDQAHGYGWIDVITGDPRVFGRVYLGTNGRGVIVADPAGK